MKKTNPTPPLKAAVESTPITSMVVHETHTELRFIGKPEVLRRINLSYPTVWKMMNEGKFPRARETGGKSAWIESEVTAWIQNRPLARLKGEAGPPRARVGGFADHPHPRAKAEA